MSDSYHVTINDLKEFSKKEIDEMEREPDSLLHQLAEKKKIKRDTIKERKNKKAYYKV